MDPDKQAKNTHSPELFLRTDVLKSVIMAQDKPNLPKLGWTLEELARSLSVSVPFLRLEIKRGRLHAAHLGRRVVILDNEIRRYLVEAGDHAV